MRKYYNKISFYKEHSHRAPPQVADRGTLARYGGYRGNKIPGVD